MPKRHHAGTTATSIVAHIEEIVVATSGEDTFELVFGVAAARILVRENVRVTRVALAAIADAHPELSIVIPEDASDALIASVDALLATVVQPEDRRLFGLDAIFETLVPRLAKGDKGQYFTPRHVVEFIVRALAPRDGEVVVDPACGSGGFLAHAHAQASVATFGTDVDMRAVRVARLIARAQGRAPETITRADGLRGPRPYLADVVATNPPFAGRADPEGFDVARVVRTPERDVLFLERSLALLKPTGRLGIVLPYSKSGGSTYRPFRTWLVQRARIYAVVALPRETFLPHTSQRTFVLFAKRRSAGETASPKERVMFLLSETAEQASRQATNAAHDLDAVLRTLRPFLLRHGFFA
jgi:type I restriction enzyme M protein